MLAHWWADPGSGVVAMLGVTDIVSACLCLGLVPEATGYGYGVYYVPELVLAFEIEHWGGAENPGCLRAGFWQVLEPM